MFLRRVITLEGVNGFTDFAINKILGKLNFYFNLLKKLSYNPLTKISQKYDILRKTLQRKKSKTSEVP